MIISVRSLSLCTGRISISLLLYTRTKLFLDLGGQWPPQIFKKKKNSIYIIYYFQQFVSIKFHFAPLNNIIDIFKCYKKILAQTTPQNKHKPKKKKIKAGSNQISTKPRSRKHPTYLTHIIKGKKKKGISKPFKKEKKKKKKGKPNLQLNTEERDLVASGRIKGIPLKSHLILNPCLG